LEKLMQKSVLSGFLAMLILGSAQAQTPVAPPAAAPVPAPAVIQAAVTPPAAVAGAASQSAATNGGAEAGSTGVLSQAANKTAQEIKELKKILDDHISDLNRNTSPGTREILAVGLGAGLGFLASGFIMTSTIAPMVWHISSNLGMSPPAANVMASTVTTVGVISGTYAGGVYARNLVQP